MKVEKKKVQADETLSLLDRLYAEGLPKGQQEQEAELEPLPAAPPASMHPAAPAAQLPDILTRLQDLQMPKKPEDMEEEVSIPSTPMIGRQ